MAAALALLPFALAAEPDGATAGANRGLASDRSGYLRLAKAPGLGALAPTAAPLQLCAEDREASGDGVRRVRCAVPPGGLPPLTGPILTPTLPQSPATPAPEPPTTPSNANEPAKAPSPVPAVDPGFRYHSPGVLAVRDATAKRGAATTDRSMPPTSFLPSGSRPGASPR